MHVDVRFPEAFDDVVQTTARPLVYDCFTFFNELDVLEIRLRELASSVDFFVLCEAAETHQGAKKPLFYEQNIERFRPFADKIIHVVAREIDVAGQYFTKKMVGRGFRGKAAWMRENCQRNAIIEGLRYARPEDWIILSDLDEIPRARIVGQIAEDAVYDRGFFVFEHDHFQFRLDLVDGARARCGSKMIQRRFLRTLQDLKKLRHAPHKKAWIKWLAWRTRCAWEVRGIVFPQRVPNGGWHFSSVGSVDKIMEKFRAVVDLRFDGASDAEYRAQVRNEVLEAVQGPRYSVVPPRDLPECVHADAARYAPLMTAALVDAVWAEAERAKAA